MSWARSLLITVFLFHSISLSAFETSVKGIADIRFYSVDSNGMRSYLEGEYGKFSYDDGSGIAISQLGMQLHVDWNERWSSTIVGNAFTDQGNDDYGLTEAYASYKGLPSRDGWRWKAKFGVFYPKISFENVATAWSTPYTLTSSALNNWVGEELRNTGVNLSLERLGRMSGSPHTFAVDLSIFQNNDPAGAMLAWHGWTLGARQTLLNEKLVLQDFPARQDKLQIQAPYSDPFLELDNRVGIHLSGHWQYKNTLKLSLGYYDNHAREGIVEEGQYTWTTWFNHLGIKWGFAKNWEIIAQYMNGNTYMTSLTFEPVVDTDFSNIFVLLRHYWQKHHIALRVEQFDAEDRDFIPGDNNNEDGTSWTMAYRYRLGKRSYALLEYSWVDSDRWSRRYIGQPQQLTENQTQLGYRYYF